jgi:hypothetical protein
VNGSKEICVAGAENFQTGEPRSYFIGNLDDVAIYDRGLSADELRYLASKRP